MHKLDLPVNCDAALLAARDYFERVTREYHTKGPDGRDRSQVQLSVGCLTLQHRNVKPAAASRADNLLPYMCAHLVAAIWELRRCTGN